MVLQQRLYDVDDLWDIGQSRAHEDKDYELVDGVLFEMVKPGGRHGQIVVRLARYLDAFVEEYTLGYVTAETGYHPSNYRRTLLAPDVAFVSHSRAPKPFPVKWGPVMPDLAIEIHSPSNTRIELRNKAQIYLHHGTQLVWLVFPAKQTVEVHRPQAEIETLGLADALSGDDVLPGFSLPLQTVFP